MRSTIAALCASAVAAAAPWIAVNTTAVANLDHVHVTFGGLTATQAADAFIGVYSPANASVATIAALPYPGSAPWTENAPVKYIMLSTLNASSGSGAWDAELINMYEDVKIWLFTGGINTPTAVASTETISFTSQPPLRGHLARTLDPSEMTVTWNSASNDAAAAVRYGPSSGVYPFTASATAATYTAADMCGDPAATHGWFPPHVWNTAVMTNLTQGAVYYYVYGSDAQGWSDEAHFRTVEAPNPHTPLNVIVYADMGMTELDGSEDHWAEPDAYTTTQHMTDATMTGEFTLALHVGDVSYATGYEAKWPLFDQRLSAFASYIPVMMGLGNHERDTPGTGTTPFETSVDSGGECGIATVTRYPMPWGRDRTSALNASWYTLTQGPLTVIMLNSELRVDNSSAQYAFLASALAAVDRTVTPWLAVAFHRPMYYGSTRDSNFAQFESLLMQYQVDVVFTGHVHYAQATCPVYEGKCVTPAAPGEYDAPIHTVIGNAGQGLTPKTAPGPIIAYQASEFGYSTLRIASATELTMYFYADAGNELHYNFTITRNYPRTASKVQLA